jgi:hypothetical protein
LSLEQSSEAELTRLRDSHLDPTFIGADQMTQILAAEAPRWQVVVDDLKMD